MHFQSLIWAAAQALEALRPFHSSRTPRIRGHTWNVPGLKPQPRPWKTGHFAIGNAAQGPSEALRTQSTSSLVPLEPRRAPRDAIQTDPGQFALLHRARMAASHPLSRANIKTPSFDICTAWLHAQSSTQRAQSLWYTRSLRVRTAPQSSAVRASHAWKTWQLPG